MKPSEDLNQAVAGATAGCLTAIITCPLDVIKTRIQNKAYGTKSPLAVSKHIDITNVSNVQTTIH